GWSEAKSGNDASIEPPALHSAALHAGYRVALASVAFARADPHNPRNGEDTGMAEAVPAAHAANYFSVRQDWLDRRKEEILEPELPIIDPHHHLWDRGGWRYLLDELLADTNSGHNILATVFVQARAMNRADGAEEMKPVGETEFVNGIAAMTASGIYG